MRPVMSELLECNGKTYRLSIPARLHELVECTRVLKIKEPEDEDDMRRTEYRSLIGVLPNRSENPYREVTRTARCLSMLTPEQLDAVKRLCAAFGLMFGNVGQFFSFIAEIKGVTCEDIYKNGIPITGEGGDHT